MAKIAADVPPEAQRNTDEPAAPGLHLDVIHLDPPSTRFVDSIVSGGIAGGGARETSLDGPFEMSAPEPATVEEPAQIAASSSLEDDALARKGIDLGARLRLRTVGAQKIRTQRIDCDQEDVWTR